MRWVWILPLLVAAVAGVTIKTPYVSLGSKDSTLRVMDMGETVWVGVGAGADHPVDSHSDGDNVSMTVADVTCAAALNVVTCTLPPTGTLYASGRLYQNHTILALGSEVYRVSMSITLEGGVWERGNVWRGTSPQLIIRVDEESPEGRKERVSKGALAFLVTIPLMLFAVPLESLINL